MIPCAIRVHWADAWIELPCPLTHTIGGHSQWSWDIFVKCHFCMGEASVLSPGVPALSVTPFVSSLPCGFCHAHLSKLGFSLCEPLCAFIFFSFLWKPAEITSCRYTPMYIGLVCLPAPGDTSMFVILDNNSVLKKRKITFLKWKKKTFVHVTCLLTDTCRIITAQFRRLYSGEKCDDLTHCSSHSSCTHWNVLPSFCYWCVCLCWHIVGCSARALIWIRRGVLDVWWLEELCIVPQILLVEPLNAMFRLCNSLFDELKKKKNTSESRHWFMEVAEKLNIFQF